MIVRVLWWGEGVLRGLSVASMVALFLAVVAAAGLAEVVPAAWAAVCDPRRARQCSYGVVV